MATSSFTRDLIGRDSSTVQEILGYFNSLDDLLCPYTVEGDAVVYRTRWHPDGCPPRTPPETSPGVYTIDIGSPGDEGFIGWGWHYQEQVGGLTLRWAGAYPQTQVYVDLPPDAYTVTLSAQASGNRASFACWSMTRRWAIRSRYRSMRCTIIRFAIPASVIGDGKDVTLTLDYDAVVVPADVGAERRYAQAGGRRRLDPLHAANGAITCIASQQLRCVLPAGGAAAADSSGAGSDRMPRASPRGDSYQWIPVASGFNSPLLVTNAGDGSGRLFVVEQDGYIFIVKNGTYDDTDPFLDISGSALERRVSGRLHRARLARSRLPPGFQKQRLVLHQPHRQERRHRRRALPRQPRRSQPCRPRPAGRNSSKSTSFTTIITAATWRSDPTAICTSASATAGRSATTPA